MEVLGRKHPRRGQHLLLHPAAASTLSPQTEPAIQLSQGILPDLVVLDLVLTDCNCCAAVDWLRLFEAGGDGNNHSQTNSSY